MSLRISYILKFAINFVKKRVIMSYFTKYTPLMILKTYIKRIKNK